MKDVRCEKIVLENGNSSFGSFSGKKWRAKLKKHGAEVKTENKYNGEQSNILEIKPFQKPQQQSNKV